MNDRDAVDHHNNQRKRRKHRLRCNSSDRRLSREVAVRKNVRNNVKHVALSRRSPGRNARNRSSNNHAVNRSWLSVAPVRLRRNGQRHLRDNNSHEASA